MYAKEAIRVIQKKSNTKKWNKYNLVVMYHAGLNKAAFHPACKNQN